MLIFKVLTGALALISAIIIFLIERNPKSFISKEGLALFLFVISSVGYIYFDFRDEYDKKEENLQFRKVMTAISKDILRSAHPYHPKRLTFDYCLERDVFMSVAKTAWKEDNIVKAQNTAANGTRAYAEDFGSGISIVFTHDPEFREGNYRKKDSDVANLLLTSHQVSQVMQTGYVRQTPDGKREVCQAVVFNIPEAGFNAFDSLNAVSALSYYDLAGTYVFLYVYPSKHAFKNGVTAPVIKNPFLVFGNGARKAYLKFNDDVRSKQLTNGVAYRQSADIPKIEEDFPSITGRFDRNN